MKKLFALLLCMVMLAIIPACGDNTGDGSSEPSGSVPLSPVTSVSGPVSGTGDITIAYNSKDSLDPFIADGEINRELMFLLHTGLYTLSESLEPEPSLAESARTDGTSVYVSIWEDASFSDGSAVTASDVVDSYNRAKKSPFYSALLSNIKSAEAVTSDEVVFKLLRADAFVLNCLTFPIVADASDIPTGAGRYYIDKNDAGESFMHLNKYCRSFSLSQNNVLGLYDVSQTSSASFAFMTGKTDAYVDTLEDFDFERLSSTACTVLTNKLVYIGANTSGSSLSSWEWLRRVINIGLDRQSVGGSPFMGQAKSAVTPFNPALYMLEGLELISDSGNRQRAVTLLEENGYDSVNSDGYRTNGRLVLRMSLLVCSDNPFKLRLAEQISADLKELGIRINIVEKNTADYTAALKAGSFDLYLGEINLCDNMSLAPFFDSKGSAGYGVGDTGVEDYLTFCSGTADIKQYIESFYVSVPFIPVCYRTSIMFYNSAYTGVSAAFTDMYASIYFWDAG